MSEFFEEAGVVIFLMVVSGGLALGWSVSFAYRPTEKKRRVTNAFLRTTLLAGVFGFLAGMTNVFRATQTLFDQATEHGKDWWKVLIVGTRESTSNLLFCFAWLALVALFVAVGEARSRAS